MKDDIKEVERLVRASPEKTCFALSNGMMFAVRDGDMSCLKGTSEKQGDMEIDGKTFVIYIGAQK